MSLFWLKHLEPWTNQHNTGTTAKQERTRFKFKFKIKKFKVQVQRFDTCTNTVLVWSIHSCFISQSIFLLALSQSLSGSFYCTIHSTDLACSLEFSGLAGDWKSRRPSRHRWVQLWELSQIYYFASVADWPWCFRPPCKVRGSVFINQIGCILGLQEDRTWNEWWKSFGLMMDDWWWMKRNMRQW